MMDLSPKEKVRIEAIQTKAAKLGFEAKIRVIYMSRKEVMNRAKVVSGFVGYIKQFMSLNLNNLKPELSRIATRVAYFNKASRLNRLKRTLLAAYINRSSSIGSDVGIFNIEELATLWHFPVEFMAKFSMLQKAPGRKADAPPTLPLDDDLPGASGQFLNFISDEAETNSINEDDSSLNDNLGKDDEINNFFGITEDDDNKADLPPNLPIA